VLSIVLALGTSLAYGTSNFLGPSLGRRHPVAVILLCGQLAALAAAVALVVAVGEGPPSLRSVLLGVVAGTGNVVGLATFYRAAQLGSVSIASAIGATGTGLPVVWGLAGGEALSALQAVGVVVAIAGAMLAAQAGGERAVSAAAAGWAAISALGLGVLLVALPEAARESTAWALFDARIAVVVWLVAGIVALGLPRRTPLRTTPLLAVPGLLLFAGTLLYAEAAAAGQLSVVAVLASLATVVTAGLAFLVHGERLSRLQLAGIALATTGVVLLASGV
jgi:drug/metabolite transporter (DMT)-like permease